MWNSQLGSSLILFYLWNKDHSFKPIDIVFCYNVLVTFLLESQFWALPGLISSLSFPDFTWEFMGCFTFVILFTLLRGSFPLHCYILSLMSLFFECVYIFQSPRTLFSFFFFTYLFLPWPHVHFLVTGSEILPDTARIPLSVKLHKCLYLSLSLSNLTTFF